MSNQNVEAFNRALVAFNRDGLDAMLRYFDPEIEWTTTGTFIEPATYRGHEGVRQYLGIVMGEFEDVHIEPHEIIDAGGDRLFVSVRISGRGRLSGAPVELTLVSVGWLRCGKTFRVRNFSDRAEALEVAGLSE